MTNATFIQPARKISDLTDEYFQAGETMYIDLGGAFAPTAVFAAGACGTIETATEKAVKVVFEHGFIWLPKKALSVTLSGYSVLYSLKKWFRLNGCQAAVIERNTRVSGISA